MKGISPRILNLAPLLLLLIVTAVFGLQSEKFLEPRNLTNILVQASSTGIVAVGMTFVLVTAGVDLSVGAIMFVAAALAGKAALMGVPFAAILLLMIATGTMS